MTVMLFSACPGTAVAAIEIAIKSGFPKQVAKWMSATETVDVPRI